MSVENGRSGNVSAAMKPLLIISGILAALAWVFPALVVFGLFLIVPGIVLTAGPTVFVYLLAAYLIRTALPLQPGRNATTVSVVLAVALGWAINQPGRWLEMRRFAAVLAPEVIPPEPLPLAGVVRLEQQLRRPRNPEPEPCDHICAALLDTPGVEAVVGGPSDAAVRMRVARGAETGTETIRPSDPGRLMDAFGRLDRRQSEGPVRLNGVDLNDRRNQRHAALNAGWTLRLATNEAVVSESVTPTEAPAWTVRLTAARPSGEPSVQRVEVLDGGQSMRFCKSVVKHRIPSRFFHFVLDGGMVNPQFTPGTEFVSNARRYDELDAEVELLLHTRIAGPTVPADVNGALRLAVSTALDAPDVGPHQVELMREWIPQAAIAGAANDEQLVQRIAADLRVPDIASLLRERYSKRAPAGFRAGFVARILAPETSTEDRDYYARMLKSMPVGTFAEPTAEELGIWQNPRIWREATPFLERLADRGEPGVGPLVAVMREAVAIKAWHERRPIVHALRKGFARLGPTGDSALPYLRELVEMRPSPVLQSAKDGLQWRKTLALMGLPVADLPYPPTFDAEQIARYAERVRRAVEQYDPDDHSGSN